VREEGADIADDARDGVLDLAELSALPDATRSTPRRSR